MVRIGALRYDIIADTQQFTKGIVATRSELSLTRKLMRDTKSPAENLGAAMVKVNVLFKKGAIDLETYNKTLRRLKNEANPATSELGGLTRAMGGFASIYTLIRGAQFAIGEAMNIESATAQMEVFVGSVSKAQAIVTEMRRLDVKSPLEFSTLAKSASTLLGFGADADTIIPTLSTLSDLAGGNAERFAGLSLVYAQATANQKLMGQDLNQFINAGFNPLLEMSEKTGKSMSELRQMMSEGAISIDMVTAAMKSATREGGRFFGSTDKFLETTEGKLSVLQGQWSTFMADLGGSAGTGRVLDLLSRGFDGLRNAATSLDDTFGNIFSESGITRFGIFGIFSRGKQDVVELDEEVKKVTHTYEDFVRVMSEEAPVNEEIIRSIDVLKQKNLELAMGVQWAEEYRLGVEGATKEQIEELRAVKARNEELKTGIKLSEDAAKAKKDAKNEKNQMEKAQKERGDAIANELRTPFEKLVDELYEIQLLMNAGAIDIETAKRQAMKAQGEFADSSKGKDKPIKVELPPSAQRGSQEEYQLVASINSSAQADRQASAARHRESQALRQATVAAIERAADRLEELEPTQGI